MKLSSFTLTQRQIDKKILRWKEVLNDPVPPSGWLRTVRTALALSGTILAKRLGVKPSTISNIEKSEIAGTVSLNTMRKLAESMGCVVVYAVVPKSSLNEILLTKAKDKARATLQRVNHTMNLEAQGVEDEEMRIQAQELVQRLLADPKGLWK